MSKKIITGDERFGDIKSTATDRSLIESARTGEGLITVTPDMLRKIGEAIKARISEWDARRDDLVMSVDEETRLAVACWTVEKIVANWKEGGTYRYLLYDRMGFGPESYLVMQDAGMLAIHHALPDDNDEVPPSGVVEPE